MSKKTKQHDLNDMRPVRAAFAAAMSAARSAPLGPDGCTHGEPMTWYWWIADDAESPTGKTVCVACNRCGAVLSGGATLD